MYELNLLIDVLPKSLNRELRTHRFARNRVNKQWDLYILSLVRSKRAMPATPLTAAKIRLVRHFYRMLDYDGLVASMKPVVDALVTAGVLKDDSWYTLGAWDVHQQFRPKSQGPLLEISIRE